MTEDTKRNADGPVPENGAAADSDDKATPEQEATEVAQPESPGPGDQQDRYAELEQELAETKDKLLRALAETENLRRRAQKERDDAAKYAIATFARDVLTVADNLRRAIDAIPEESRHNDDAVRVIAEGIELTERELLAAFDRCGIMKVDPMGEKFDHTYHEAMFEVPTDDAAPGTVVQVMEVGYVLHDRLLRPARVGVAKAPSEPPPSEGADTTA